MLRDETKKDSYTGFFGLVELRLRQALIASFGPEVGRDASAEALAYGWEHWDRVSVMDNPVGFLYRVGQTHAGRLRRRDRVVLPLVVADSVPWVEPGLPKALRKLSERQRTVVVLTLAYEWSMSEVAGLLGVSKATVQSYSDRAQRRLRISLGAEL